MRKAGTIIAVFTTIVLGIGAVTINNDKLFDIAKNIEIFTKVYRELNTFYVDDIDPNTLMKTGIDAMVSSLDPYTNYFSETQIENWRYMTEGKYEGIGARINTIGGKMTVTEVYEDCPAQESGLIAGDIIQAIDGKATQNLKNEEVSMYLKGVPGTKVTLKIERPGVAGTKDYIVTRGEIKMSNTPYAGMITDQVGYISLVTFTQNAAKNVEHELRKLKLAHPDMKGVILDLRDNGGGLLNEAIDIVNLFEPANTEVVSTRSRVVEWDKSFKTRNAPVDTEIPLVVLVNKNSASASEIVSGSIQDLDRGVIIGQRSFGKGLVQQTKEVGYNSKVKITISKYYIPSGRCIQSVSYKNGEPVDIPDSQRNKFKTRNGRIVLDGGGITPDIKIDPHSGDAAMKALIDSFLIFKFCVDYAQTHPKMDDPKTYQFTDFDAFLKYIESSSTPYVTETEAKLNELESSAKTEDYLPGIKNELSAARKNIQQEKRDVLIKHKDDLQRYITKTLVTRYYYQKGKIINGIQNDVEVDAAVKLFNDPSRYRKILAGK